MHGGRLCDGVRLCLDYLCASGRRSRRGCSGRRDAREFPGVELLDEGMLREVSETNALRTIMHEHALDEIFRLGRDRLIGGEFEVDLADALVRLAILSREERRLTDQKFVHEDTERPRINAVIMLTALDHLRREVIEGAAKRLPPFLLFRVHRPAEVGQLHCVVLTEQQILGFDVADKRGKEEDKQEGR